MALDLYQRLGIQRGASDDEIKKAYRSLAKQLHPDRNQDNPDAAKRFGEVTAAYDLLSDKDKRARYDRGEIDEDGNPKMPFGGGFGGYSRGGPRPGGTPEGFENFNFGGADTADLSDLFEGLFGAAASGRGRPGQGGFGGFRQRQRAPQKGADVSYRLKIAFVDAVALTPQRITLGDGKAIDLKLPKGVEHGTRIRISGKGEDGPGGRGDAIVTIDIAPHKHFTRDGDDIRLTLPVTLKEAVLGAKIKAPTPEGPVMLTVPKGTTSGKVLRLKGRGFTRKDGKRGDLLVTLDIDLPPNDAALQRFAESWSGGGNPRAGLDV
ncbi:J domain-containing protein [Sphingomonas lutea]|uniref:J domain-containing protein n=1 Tax=Sphingomonas lutea TaxID=1045317 RepID=A0A7G9SHN6_9SPHN|nr:J domain-containing protein [Sphingomonas lutea]QNN67361.1 J domain-containing protein [Sphingomonas lutea]